MGIFNGEACRRPVVETVAAAATAAPEVFKNSLREELVIDCPLIGWPSKRQFIP
jgi:hypothetical protein